MNKVCVVAGVGPGNGAAFARRFGAEGYSVALLARSTTFSVKVASTVPDARVYECDVADAAAVSRTFEASWRVNALGGFLASKQVIPAMKRAGRGNIVFVGATASRKGGPRSAAFSSAKGAQRNLAESMARALWPSGIHVALIVVDGVVDLPRTRERMPDKPDSFFIKPDDVAEIGFRLTQQRPSAWSFEVEARPYGETW